MPRDFRHVLDDINDALEGILSSCKGKGLGDYQNDWLLKNAVQRGIEIISEASRRLPDEVVASYPEIPWQRVRTIGNVLRHEYHALADRVIWNVVIDELPRLKKAISDMSERFHDG